MTIIGKFGSGDLSHLQTTRLVVLGFSGFLRWDDLLKLRRRDLEFEREYMRVYLERRKNDQYQEGSWILIAGTSNPTCPVQLLEKFLWKGGDTEAEQFRFQKDFAHCKWHESQETKNDLL